jgi:hypothetical protein
MSEDPGFTHDCVGVLRAEPLRFSQFRSSARMDFLPFGTWVESSDAGGGRISMRGAARYLWGKVLLFGPDRFRSRP